MTKPKEDKQWTLREEGREIHDEKEIAEIFNQFFIRKIEDLKDNINTTQIKDPIEKLREKIGIKKLDFTLKTVTEKKVVEVMGEMKKKKSSGMDGIGQDLLLMGADVIAARLSQV